MILFLLIYFFPMFSDIDSLPCWCWTTSSETLLSSSAKDVPDLWPGRQKVFGETVVKHAEVADPTGQVFQELRHFGLHARLFGIRKILEFLIFGAPST